MSLKKRLGYNWKARQQDSGTHKKRSNEADAVSVEFDPSVAAGGGGRELFKTPQDTNVEVLLPKKSKLTNEGTASTAKRKKLNSKQRKRLLKVIEAKEKKAKKAVVLESLASLALPDTHASLLQPSVQVGRAKRTRKDIQNEAQLREMLLGLGGTVGRRVHSEDGVGAVGGDIDHLVGTTWRKKSKKRRALKAEKVLFDPLPKRVRREEEEEEASESSGCDSSFDAEEDQKDVCRSESTEINQDSREGEHGKDVKHEEGGDTISSEKGGTGDREETRTCVASGSSSHKTTKEETCEPRVPALFVQLDRDPNMQAARLSLPILSEEQTVMEAINAHPTTILCGETGSGKTTQVPQFLYEAGYTMRGCGNEGKGLIGVTEPRRVAAVSMARRVKEEMGFRGSEVAYQIRYEGNTSEDTVIKFMTDGVLLKEVEKDFLLSRYSVIVIDEAHERSVFTDILIGLLSRIVPLREKNGNPLKLVIMSATLRVEDFTQNKILFPLSPPVIKIDSRQYPVTVHFNRRTPDDYLTEALRKVCKIHRMLQPGHILVFLTGQREVHQLCSMLRRRFPRGCGKKSRGGGVTARREEGSGSDGREGVVDEALVADEEGLEGMMSADEEEEEEEGEFLDSQLPMEVLPLYSLLPPAQQTKVFEPPGEGVRLCVVATNVAETSLTIPNVKYVVDSGKVKRRYYDKVTGISTFRVTWTSKASANQRAGRAGRTEPGHCYRLFSSSVFHNEFEEFSPPEMTRRPVDDLVLQMKAMNIEKVVNFPFPTPPSLAALNAAESLLQKLGALNSPQDFPSSTPLPLSVTPLGRTMAQFPVAPRYAKMLVLGGQQGCMPYVIALVSALSVNEVFEVGGAGEEGGKKSDGGERVRRSWAGKGECLLLGDLMVLLRVVGACEYAGCSQQFCARNHLRHRAMLEIRKLRQQLTNIVNTLSPESPVVLDPNMPPLTPDQAKCMRQIVLSGLGDHVARKVDTRGMNAEDRKRLRYAYETPLCEAPVFLHHSSALFHNSPEFLVFQEITETSKLYMRGVCAVEASWLPLVQPDYCTFSTPLEEPPPFFDEPSGTIKCHMNCTYGKCNWPIGSQEMPYPNSLMKYKLFAMFLLQGKVIPELAKYSPSLLVAPISLLRKWSNLHKQCEVLVAALANKEVCSRDKLLAVWKLNSKYLLKAMSMWLPESRHYELSISWPPNN